MWWGELWNLPPLVSSLLKEKELFSRGHKCSVKARMKRAKLSTSSALRVTGLLNCLPKVSPPFPPLTLDSFLAVSLPSTLYAREGGASAGRVFVIYFWGMKSQHSQTWLFISWPWPSFFQPLIFLFRAPQSLKTSCKSWISYNIILLFLCKIFSLQTFSPLHSLLFFLITVWVQSNNCLWRSP